MRKRLTAAILSRAIASDEEDFELARKEWLNKNPHGGVSMDGNGNIQRWKDNEDFEAKNGYDPNAAEEWMKNHPNGWYNSEFDKGTGDEEVEELEDFNDRKFSTVPGDLNATLTNLEDLQFGFTSIGSKVDKAMKRITFYLEEVFGIDFSDEKDNMVYENGQKGAANFARNVAKGQIESGFPEWTVIVPSSWISKYGIKAGRKKSTGEGTTPAPGATSTTSAPAKEKVKLDNKDVLELNKKTNASGSKKVQDMLKKKGQIEQGGKITGTNVTINTAIGRITMHDFGKIIDLLGAPGSTKQIVQNNNQQQ